MMLCDPPAGTIAAVCGRSVSTCRRRRNPQCRQARVGTGAGRSAGAPSAVVSSGAVASALPATYACVPSAYCSNFQIGTRCWLQIRTTAWTCSTVVASSTAAGAYERFRHPAMAMAIQADAALDVGDTLVGMHIRPVAVPLRMPEAKIGQAHVVMAYARYPLIGGARAQYPEAIR